VIRLATEKIEPFLDRNTHRTAAAPQADEKIRPETGIDDVGRKLEGIQQQVIGGDVAFVHSCSYYCERVLLAAAMVRAL
jgi:hypothetical protein